ncbi:MAG: putative glycosyltransferase [Frankiales bacterium]|nr:putative glycosyltransferase [Frankiales bacterium]
MNVSLAVSPVMSGPSPEGAGATWIGRLDRSTIPAGPIPLRSADGYERCRFLITEDRMPLGFVELDVVDGAVDGEALTALAQALPAPTAILRRSTAPAGMSIIVCTRDRADQLAVALDSIANLEHDAFEVIVVDNAPRTNATNDVVAALNDPRFRVVIEPKPGLARARNAGVRAAVHEVVAFTDDDVVVDRQWLQGIADGFSRSSQVGVVTGIVPSGEIRTPSQAYFDKRVSWASSCEPRLFDIGEPPVDDPLFPFHVGVYGTGANFAMRRSTVMDLGGFDEALGAGSPTSGGEDIDMFVRAVVAGVAIAYEPSAIVWHRHRADSAAIRDQASGYGRGLGAWLTKVMLDASLRSTLLRRAPAAFRQARRVARQSARGTAAGPTGNQHDRALVVREAFALASGPWAYARARRRGAHARPLARSTSGGVS